MTKYEQLRLLTENKMVKQLIDYDQIYINVHSSDCDGGNSNYGLTFGTIPELYEWERKQAEHADGPFGWDVVEPSELIKESTTWFTR